MRNEKPSEPPTVLFAHLSDLHYVSEESDTTLSTPTHTRKHLELALQQLESLGEALSFILISGDLVDRGQLADYRKLRQELARLKVPMLLALGNHDDLGSFSEIFEAHGATYDHATLFAGLHVITLDSHVPQRVYGELQKSQIHWLQNELARFPELPKVIQIHHPPVFGKPAGASDEWHHLATSSSEALRQALVDYQVVGIFSGHVHTDQFTLWQGIPCFSTAGLNNTTDVTFQGGLRALRAASFNLCTVSGGGIRVAALPLLALKDELFTLSAEQLQRFNPSATLLPDKEHP